MSSTRLRTLVRAGSLATLAVISSGGLVSATNSASSCPTWPLCTESLMAPMTPLVWVALAHRVLVLLALVLVTLGAVTVWRSAEADRWVRLPLLAAPLLGLIQMAVGAMMVALQLYAAANVTHLGGALLVLACQVVPWAALAQPATIERLGGRAAREAGRLTGLAWWTAGATGVLAVALSAQATLTPTVLAATLLPANTGGALAMVGLLAAGTLGQMWRVRRDDRVLLMGALGVLLLTIAEVPLLLLTPAAAGFSVGLSATLWGVALALAVVTMRRPAMVLAAEHIQGVPAPAMAQAARPPSLVRDYLSLTKPKVIALLLVTTAAAMYLTEAGPPSLGLVCWTMVGGYLAAGGAGAINCAFDREIDLNMGRTSRRPVPSGRISQRAALRFGLTLSALSVVVLLVFTTPLAAFCSTLGIGYYAWIYTQWLKRSTWQNVVIGGGAGAIPPLVGWTAVTGHLSLAAVLLFAIVFYWTPPHFWALALVKQQDYARAGVPMLPVVAGEGETRWQILIYATILVALSLVPTLIGALGWLYLASAGVLGLIFLYYAWAVWRKGDRKSIWGLYMYSLLYLALLFVVMVVDRVVL